MACLSKKLSWCCTTQVQGQTVVMARSDEGDTLWAMRVLVVEDDAAIRLAVVQALREEGYAVDSAADGEEGAWYLRDSVYDAAVLDIMLPRYDGLSLVRDLRARSNATPVLLLTARDAVADRVQGLDCGADDYVVKPFALAELLARVRVLVRRAHGAATDRLEIADLVLDAVAKRAWRGERELSLAPREYQVLEYLARRAGAVVSRAELEQHIYDFNDDPSSNVVDAAVARLRRKLHGEGEIPLVHTRRGQGFCLSAEVSA